MIHHATTLALGIYCGSLLTEAFILVPYWRRMPPSEFLRLHGTMGPSLFRYFAPLTLAAAGLAILNGIIGHDDPVAVIVALLAVAALATFPVYFRAANAAFASGRLTEAELPAELARWQAWHRFRTLLVILAFGLSVVG
ncbi:MAG: hypothetical protein VYB54_13655 [Pseudomonadota bacterium]|nr:hypothetical protein [Pseudomonadota bacterium]